MGCNSAIRGIYSEQTEIARESTLWLLNINTENGPFIDGLPIKGGDFPWRTVK